MSNPKPNLVLMNGSLYTVDQDSLFAEAIAISGDKIIFVGSDKDVNVIIEPDTEVIDLGGKMVLPSFVDAHAHPSHAIDLFGNINLYRLDSNEKYQQGIHQFFEENPHREVYRGSGWDNTIFPNRGPGKDILDAIIPHKPISLVSNDGHSLWVNSASLERAQITTNTQNPEGGVIERDPDTGEPSGTLRETAMKLVENVLPDYTLDERVNTLHSYQEMAFKAGVTMCHDAMLDEQSIAGFKQLEADGSLRMRFRGAITMEPDQPPGQQIEFLLSERARNSHPKFQTNTAKIFVDGVVEGGTAYLLEPYQHLPDFYGESLWDAQQLKEICAALDKEYLQIHIHVIGDAAARIALDALEHAQQVNGKRDSRHLITHLQLVTPEDILRFKELDVIGVPNPYWFKLDEYYTSLALPYLGKERADQEYPMRSFLDAGVLMASASDFPVTIPFDPLIGIETGITRAEIGSVNGDILWPQERVNLEQMIASFTYNGAYANFLEDQCGSLTVGKHADFIILDQNLFEIPQFEIARAKVLNTFLDGQEVYRSVE